MSGVLLLRAHANENVTYHNREFKSMIGQLIQWLDSSIETSVNQPSLPYVIVVLNDDKLEGEVKNNHLCTKSEAMLIGSFD